jgi:hypothetical protein
MEDRWLVVADGASTGPYSLGDLQLMLSSGKLKGTASILKEGAIVAIPARSVPGLFPDGSPEKAPNGDAVALDAQAEGRVPSREATPVRKRLTMRSWALVLTGLAVAVIGAYLAWDYFSDNDPLPDPNLPEWFSPRYRIKKSYGIIAGPALLMRTGRWHVQATGTASPGRYTEEWLDKHFTHYVSPRNGFVWTRPRVVYPSDGKILGGVKVIVGGQVNELSYVCTLDPEGRPINMYMLTMLLVDRSQGPPPEPDDD